MTTINRSDTAIQDLDDLAKFIQRESPQAAIRFLSAAEATFQCLAAMPELGQRQSFGKKELADVRVWQVREFENYLIFYKPSERGIDVLRVLHASRDAPSVFDETT